MDDWAIIIIAITALTMIGGVVKTSIRARHGDTRTWRQVRADRAAGVRDPVLGAGREFELLTGENDRLKGQVARLEERLSVVERIVTDPARRIAAEIDGLR